MVVIRYRDMRACRMSHLTKRAATSVRLLQETVNLIHEQGWGYGYLQMMQTADDLMDETMLFWKVGSCAMATRDH